MATTIKAMVLATMAAMAAMVGGCAGGKLVPMPLDEASAGAPRPVPEEVIVWVGHGQTERMEDGRWVRAPAFDYDFSVEQRRFGDHWESVKTMRRASPDYDGSAGPRDESLTFKAEPGAKAYGLAQNQYLLERAEALAFSSTFTFNGDGSFSYTSDLVLRLAATGGELHHTDRNTLHRVKRIHPGAQGQ